MSFNLVRHKNGREIPIKVSILDAFKISPSKKPKQVQISTKPAPIPVAVGPMVTVPAQTANMHSTADVETFTAEDDAKLLALKADGKSWKDILEALHKKSKSQLQAHFKEIAPKTNGDTKKDDESKAEGLAKASQAKAKKEGSGGSGGSANGKSNKANNTAAALPEKLTKDNLKTFVAKYERDKWLAAASRHFDLTGQRISPETAKKLAESKG